MSFRLIPIVLLAVLSFVPGARAERVDVYTNAFREGGWKLDVQFMDVMGNASGEVRVWSTGEIRHPLVNEVRSKFMNTEYENVYSDSDRIATLEREPNLSLFFFHRAFGVEKQGERIAAVKALDVLKNRVVEFRAPHFCDATGDGWVGFWAGAEWRYGREGRGETGEKFAPEKGDHIFCEQDITEKRLFDDAVATGSWSIDLHYTIDEKIPFLTRCEQPRYGRYWIPYRSLYSRNVPSCSSKTTPSPSSLQLRRTIPAPTRRASWPWRRNESWGVPDAFGRARCPQRAGH